jgi:predicted transcriptional regulator
MRTRDRVDIISSILNAANGGNGATKAKMAYNAFLSYQQLKKYLRALTHNNLIKYDFSSQKFRTTQKGFSFLKAYNQIDEMMNVQQQKQFYA